jgi:hypothetical protein
MLGALASAGCSIPLDSTFAKHGGGDDDLSTGSISRAATHPAALAAQPSQADLAYARATAIDVFARDSKENSVPWQNPQTGVGGNITPLASSYSEDGLPCRGFLATYVRGGAQSWLQGSACRTGHGEWEVRTLKPITAG